MTTKFSVEGRTMVLIAICYAAWVCLTFFHVSIPLVILIPLLTITLSFHSSLQHEAIHDHPTSWLWLNEVLASPALSLWLPYIRYRETHRQHHQLENISYPQLDPESYYLTATQWQAAPAWKKTLLNWNNTLCGRLLIGPALSIYFFIRAEISLLLAGGRSIQWAWFIHLLSLIPVLAWLMYCDFPWGIYLLVVYASVALSSIRSFAEHQAMSQATERTIIIESQGFFSWLFLENNLHAVHHQYPNLPWYHLRNKYQEERDLVLKSNSHYCLSSYTELFKRYFWQAKEPVMHPWL